MPTTRLMVRKEPKTRNTGRAAKTQALKRFNGDGCLDDVDTMLKKTSLSDTPKRNPRRQTSKFSEAFMPDELEDDEDEILDDVDEERSESEDEEDEEVEEEPKQKRRKSKREIRPPSDSYTSSLSSTPRKKGKAIQRGLKRGKKTRGYVGLPKINILDVDGAALPGREAEFKEIQGKLATAIRSQQGLCLYLSGVPGTGKTATVREVIGSLQKNPALEEFDYIEVNGMKLSDPGQVYPLLWRHLGQQERTTSSTAALKHLKGYFAKSPRPVIVLLDELDALLQKKHSVLYHFFEWTGLDTAKLIIVAIANTMDLPERLLSNRIASRMGLNRINFVPYHYSQLQAIILHRLQPYKDWFHADALEMCSRKVSSVSGDARRAIAYASRAVDFITARSRHEGGKGPAANSITLKVMNDILATTFSGTPVWAIRSCSGLQLIMLDAVSCVWKNQFNAYDTSFYNVCNLFWQKCRLKNIGYEPTAATVKMVIWSLVSASLVRLEPMPAHGSISVDTKVVALFSDEDLQIALGSS